MSVAWDSDVTLTIEAAFGYGVFETPTWTDISQYVRSIETVRGRSAILDQTQAGEMVLTLKNDDSRFEPDNSSGPYSGNLIPLVPVRFQAEENSITFDIWRGYIRGWPQQTRHNVYGDVVAPCVDAFHILAMLEEEITEAEELSGTRIGNLLDRAGFPAGLRDLDAGTHSVAALSAEWNSILGEIRRTELVEQGLFHIAGNGDATYRDGVTRLEDTTIQATFSDDGADIAWVGDDGIEPTLDTAQIWNQAEVTRVGSTSTQTATDAASVTAYGPRTLSLSETLHVADGEASALADWVVSEYKDADRTRVRALRIEPQGDPSNRWPVALGLELWDKVNVERTPSSSSSTIDRDHFIEGIQHTVRLKGSGGGAWWETRFQLSPELAHTDWWVLGQSELGTDTRLGY